MKNCSSVELVHASSDVLNIFFVNREVPRTNVL